jgi:hypothetical protein
MKVPQCGKCGGKMTPGHVLDQGHMGWASPLQLIMGLPRKTALGNYDSAGRTKYVLQAFRCESCTAVEFYAPEEKTD